MTIRYRSLLSWLWLLVLVFQVSVLADSFEIHGTSRAVNAVVLVVFLMMAIVTACQDKPRNVLIFFVLPVALVLVGYSINVLRSLSLETLGYIGMLLPWLAVLSVPFMKFYSLEDSWVLFYRFTLIFAVVACAEYYAVFSGMLATKPITITRGDYEVGIFTIFQRLPNGAPYDRMFGVFPEPGTLGMLLLPAIAYALVFGKWWALVPFLICMWLSRPLGAWASLVLVVAAFVYWRVRSLAGRAVLLMLLTVCVSFFFLPFFITSYQQKDASATVRENNFFVFLANLPGTLIQYPIGAPLVGKSLSVLERTERNYLGSSFAPYTALILGGVSAFVGYSAILLVALLTSAKYFARGRNSDKILACAFITLPALVVFVFQRATVFDTPVFAFLLAVPVITVIRGEQGGARPKVPLRNDGAARSRVCQE